MKDRLIRWLGGVTGESYHRMERNYEKELYDLRRDAEAKILKATKLAERTPEDCTRGAWCDTCKYARKTCLRVGYSVSGNDITVTYCTRDEFCQRYEEETK